jgi:hypothetical protein
MSQSDASRALHYLNGADMERPMANYNFDGRVVYGTVQAGESTADYRTRMESLQAEALERWQKLLAEQSSVLNSPSDRIRVWERRHQIDLPRDPGHRLVNLIAADTGLSAEEVQAEQRLRAEARLQVVAIDRGFSAAK